MFFSKQKSLGVKENYHSVCYKITKKGCNQLPVYILGSVHFGMPSSVGSVINSFINDIRPSVVYFEVDWSSASYLYQLYHGTEYYVHQSAMNLGSSFKGLESIWYQVMMLGREPTLFGIPVNPQWMQRYTKTHPFLGNILISLLTALINVIKASIGAVKGLAYMTSIFLLPSRYYALQSGFTMIKAIDAYTKEFKFPHVSPFLYWFSNKTAALDVRNQDWVERIVKLRFDGKEEESDESFLYSMLSVLAGFALQVSTGLLYIGYALSYLPLMLVKFLLTSIGLEPSFTSPFVYAAFKSPSDEDELTLPKIYQTYRDCSKSKIILSYEEFLSQRSLNDDQVSDEAQREAYAQITSNLEAEPKCSELYVVGSMHLIAPTGKGVIDLLRAHVDQEGISLYEIDEIDLNLYKPNRPLILTKSSKAMPLVSSVDETDFLRKTA